MFGTYTPVDIARSIAFGQDQAIRQICAKMPGTTFKINDSKRIWDYPCYKDASKTCASAADCGGLDCIDGVCGYCPSKEDIAPGSCYIGTQELCAAMSDPEPYICDGSTCRAKQPDILPDSKCSGDSDCIKGCDGTYCKCTSNEDCKVGSCDDGQCKHIKQPKPYLIWTDKVATCTANTKCPNGQPCVGDTCGCATDQDCPGAQKCDGGKCTGPSCILGNYPLKQFCTRPESSIRAAVGMAGQPPLSFNEERQVCELTAEYCQSFGLGFNPKSCASSSDCPSGSECIGGACIGCTSTLGQDVGKILIGESLFSLLSGTCKKENFSRESRYLIEPRLVAAKKLLKENEGGDGIHLYLLTWHPDAGIRPLTSLGFDGAALERSFPQLVKKIGGRRYITFNGAPKDRASRRLYMFYLNSGWMNDMFRASLNK